MRQMGSKEDVERGGPGGRRVMKASKGKWLCIFGEKLVLLNQWGYKVVKKKTGVENISCSWTTQVINPSFNHLTSLKTFFFICKCLFVLQNLSQRHTDSRIPLGEMVF